MSPVRALTILALLFEINLLFNNQSTCLIIWRNTTCEIIDKNFAQFEYCSLKKNISSGLNVFSTHVKLLQKPVTNCKIQIDFNSGLKTFPIRFNTTWDACKFMRNTRRFKALKMFYRVISDRTNINHTCPYDHDIIVKDLGPVEIDLNFPLVSGLYQYNTAWIIDNKIRLTIGGIAEYKNLPNGKKSNN